MIGRSSSLASKYTGPWIVTGVLSSVTYRIERGRAKPRIVHGDRLKFYYGEVTDPWSKKKHVPRSVAAMMALEGDMCENLLARLDQTEEGCLTLIREPAMRLRKIN